MAEYNIYRDIAERTGGDVYLGVVGPVRTGKSTFIKKFMDLFVLPNMEDAHAKERAQDELPQSAGGKTIMTTEPKFIPNDAVEITLADHAKMKVRMIDCVGYIVKNALGHMEEDAPRMVSTPWSDQPMPFGEAAEIGTKKVICDHSTIGILVTTDGSVTDIPREDYLEAERRVAHELKDMGKPFVILLNTKYPDKPETEELRAYLEEEYASPVVSVNCLTLTEAEIREIMTQVLLTFPVREIGFCLPDWMDALPDNHRIKKGICDAVSTATDGITALSGLKATEQLLSACEYIESVHTDHIDLGSGVATLSLKLPKELFYNTAKELSGFDIGSEGALLHLLTELSHTKKEYEKVAVALREVEHKGYGIVTPTIDEMRLEEPEIVKQGNRFGVKLKAAAPSIHMIKADIKTEVCPIVGTEKQSEELVHYLLKEFETDPKEIWQSNIFGKSLHELVNEGLHNKLSRMPDEAQIKLQETLQKIINEGSGGLICIIL
ncbi:MAG: stage IV sporulation protein A [Clostridia bacterium]|nr:stage IV sporulation protein A [Clostridia bacterium]